MYHNKGNPTPEPSPPTPASHSYAMGKPNQQLWNISLSSHPTAQPHRPIHPTFSYLMMAQPPNSNKKTSAKPCIPPSLLPLQYPTPNSALPLSSKMDPRLQCISTSSFKRVTYQGRLTTPTASESDAVSLPHRNTGVTIHKFEQHWDEMMMDKTLFPGHNMVSSFLRSYRSHN